MRGLRAFPLGFTLSVFPHVGQTQTSDHELAQIVAQRTSLMFDLQTAYLTLLSVQRQESDDFQAAAESAKSMINLMTKFVSLMNPGTARGEAPGSRAKPQVWVEANEFQAAADHFRAKAAELATVAENANHDEYSNAFETFTQACTGCHGLRPSSGGKFRFEK